MRQGAELSLQTVGAAAGAQVGRSVGATAGVEAKKKERAWIDIVHYKLGFKTYTLKSGYTPSKLYRTGDDVSVRTLILHLKPYI